MRNIPATPLALGLAGLLPFWLLAVGLAARGLFGFEGADLDRALATYAAIIISFLGGIRWGLVSANAEQSTANFVLSVLPSLAAWMLLGIPEPWRLASLGLVALVLGPLDTRLVTEGLAPRWLGRLRLILSAGAGVALLFGAFAVR